MLKFAICDDEPIQMEQPDGMETDETKRKVLQTKLIQVERELSQKDNEAYRRQHTVFS